MKTPNKLDALANAFFGLTMHSLARRACPRNALQLSLKVEHQKPLTPKIWSEFDLSEQLFCPNFRGVAS